MNEGGGSTRVNEGRYFVVFLNKYKDLEFLVRFEKAEEEFRGGIGTHGRGGRRFID